MLCVANKKHAKGIVLTFGYLHQTFIYRVDETPAIFYSSRDLSISPFKGNRCVDLKIITVDAKIAKCISWLFSGLSRLYAYSCCMFSALERFPRYDRSSECRMNVTKHNNLVINWNNMYRTHCPALV